MLKLEKRQIEKTKVYVCGPGLGVSNKLKHHMG